MSILLERVGCRRAVEKKREAVESRRRSADGEIWDSKRDVTVAGDEELGTAVKIVRRFKGWMLELAL